MGLKPSFKCFILVREDMTLPEAVEAAKQQPYMEEDEMAIGRGVVVQAGGS